ncbi:hypothetical protein COLO4_15851 [Corchorus olitorius]|uniref:Uncharacterized protein n=1 Tax=Corchorus olitorius TaxID=93759 RepID=A0A1R3JL01_9ROSI|nr:hypothetical protein COLO4_15851 [Corchorus olitorius]
MAKNINYTYISLETQFINSRLYMSFRLYQFKTMMNWVYNGLHQTIYRLVEYYTSK